MREKLLAALRQYWGYEGFREMQYEIISSVLSGKDTLALMPTGGGKSITYQLPTLVSEGLCIVITPLIALMKDQVDGLRARGIQAVAIHSGLSRKKIDRLLDNCVYGDIKFLYVSPERLNSDIFQLRVRRMNVSLIAVDEAHCISQWGYDFRPAYLHIARLRELQPDVPVLALTASATDRVADDIMAQLKFDRKRVLRSSFARPNLSYVVRKVDDKEEQLLRIIGGVAGSGIVYVRKRNTAEQLAEFLQQQGISASYYHGGLPAEERSIRQDEWVDGKVRVMVATNAFGMGIDKSDVRFVVHYTLCDNMESYYQEAGRAGRDGKRSYATLLVSAEDYRAVGRRLDSSFPPIDVVKQIYNELCSFLMIAIGDGKGHKYIFNIHDFCAKYHYFPTVVLGAIDLLERNEYLTYVEVAENPARVIFRVGRDDLYNIDVSKRTELVMLTILRFYSGVFTEFRAIDELEIASAAKLHPVEVRESLKELWIRQIIRYVPANSSPMICMNEERLPLADLYIAPKTYSERKAQMMARFDTMIEYADNNSQCRSVVIQRYFGDTSAEPCGCCDICLAKKRGVESADIEREVEKILVKGNSTLRDIAHAIQLPPQKISAALSKMAESGAITISDAGDVALVADRGSEK